MTSTSARARFRFQWMEAVLGSDLPSAEKTLAIRIALHCNDVTGQCNPSEATLAKGTGLTPRYVRILKAKLEQKRWVRHAENRGGARQGKGISNNYELLPPPDRDGATRNSCSGLVDGSDEPTRNCGTTNPELWSNQPGTTVPPNTTNNNLNREKDICGPLEIGIEGEVLPPTVEQATRPTEFDEAEATKAAELTEAELEAEFETFWKQCPRAVDYGKARKIYCRIVRDGKATPGELLKGMMIYAAAREGQDGCYTKTPPTWLANSCWRDDPEAISPKSLLKRALSEMDMAGSWSAARHSPPPDPVAQQRHQEDLELRQKASRRKQVDECKGRIRTGGYRSGPHWFEPDIYQEALAELEAENPPVVRAAG
jgi:hypothetical protein